MADDVVGKLIFKVETDTKDAKKGLDSFQEEMKETQTGAKKTEQTVDKANKAIMASGIGIALAVGTALIKLGKQVAEATKDIQDGEKAIVNATGATGKSLEGLMSSAKKVFSSNSASFDEVSGAIGEINTRLGLTDKALEETTDSFIKFAQTTGQDVTASVQNVTQVMNRWGVETAKLPNLLDKLTVAGQLSGVSVATLEANLTSGAGTLQAMGYSLDESISMMMTFEKQGIDSSQVIMGMKKSFEDSARAGTDARADWESLIDSIANATSEAEANSIAIETFGNRVATDMVTALKSGSVSFDEFTEAIEDSDGALKKTHETAKTASDRFQEFKNMLKTMMGSVGQGIIEMVFGQKSAVDDLGGSVDALVTSLDNYNTIAKKLTGNVEDLTGMERALLEVELTRAGIEADKAFRELADTFSDASDEIDSLERKSAPFEARLHAIDNIILGISNGSLDDIASELAELQKKGEEGTLTPFEYELRQIYTEYLPDMSYALKQGGKDLEDWKMSLWDIRMDILPEVLELTGQYTDKNADMNASIVKLAVAFKQGILDIEKYSELYPELTARIVECAEKMGDSTKKQEDDNKKKKGGADATKKQIEASEEYIKRLKEQEDAMDEAYASELEKQGKIADAYDLRLIKVQHNATEELNAIRDKITKGEALEEDYENALEYWQNEQQRLRNEKIKKVAEANAKEVEEEEKKAKALEEIRQKESDSWVEKLRKQADEARLAIASEKEAMGKISEAYDIREQVIRDEWEREKKILEEKVAKNEATQDDITKLNAYYNAEIEKNNKDKTDAIEKQETELAEKIKQKNKETFQSTISMAMSLVNQLGNVFSGIADNYKTQLDKIEKARNADIENYKKASDTRLDYLKSELEEGLISDEEYKNKRKKIEDDLAKATKDRTQKDEKAEKELRRKVDEMSRKAFEAKKKTAIAQAIIDGASAIMKGFAELGPIAGAVYAGVQAGITTAQTVVIANQEYVPSYAVGSKYIPRNQLAMLHEGEMVLTRRESTKMREIGGVDNLERMVSGSVGTESRSLEPMRIENQLNAVIEVDGTQLGIAVLKNIDNASQFVLR